MSSGPSELFRQHGDHPQTLNGLSLRAMPLCSPSMNQYGPCLCRCGLNRLIRVSLGSSSSSLSSLLPSLSSSSPTPALPVSSRRRRPPIVVTICNVCSRSRDHHYGPCLCPPFAIRHMAICRYGPCPCCHGPCTCRRADSQPSCSRLFQ